MMFATVSTAELDDSTPTELRTKRINEEMLPALKERPGFVTGYWLGPLDGRGMSVVLWDSEDTARAYAATRPPGTEVQPGVTVRSVDVRPVIAAG